MGIMVRLNLISRYCTDRISDMAIITNGTLLSIQNMTWNGQLGFQSAPSEEVYIDIIDTQWSAVYEANGLPGFPGPQTTMGIQAGFFFINVPDWKRKG